MPCTAGEKTGPNPTDRRKAGSKHPLLVDAHWLPLVILLTAANRHDSTQLQSLVAPIPAIRGKPGHPRCRPGLVQGDRAYGSRAHRRWLRQRGIQAQLAQRLTPHGSGLGQTRWVVERTIAWLHQFRRLKLRYERQVLMHEAFLNLAASLICWRALN